MASIYVPVRIAFLVLSGIGLILSIMDLVRELQGYAGDTTNTVSMSIIVIVLFIGAYGSFRHDRIWLMTFGLILIIAIIVGFFSKHISYSPLSTSIVLVVLALTQAELIKRGYH